MRLGYSLYQIKIKFPFLLFPPSHTLSLSRSALSPRSSPPPARPWSRRPPVEKEPPPPAEKEPSPPPPPEPPSPRSSPPSPAEKEPSPSPPQEVLSLPPLSQVPRIGGRSGMLFSSVNDLVSVTCFSCGLCLCGLPESVAGRIPPKNKMAGTMDTKISTVWIQSPRLFW